MLQISIIYLIISTLLSGLQFINRNSKLSNILIILFLSSQWYLTIHAINSIGTTECSFFRFDGLAIIFTSVVSIISTAAFVHSSHYITSSDMKNSAIMRAQYNGAMQMLTMALTMAYLSTHIAMTWIFVEITTLSASALIFYRRNAGSIEATWKYVFACSISLVLVYVGILFFSIGMGEINQTGLTIDELSEHATEIDSTWLKFAFIFILVGYTAKMSLVPMFTAGIDAKDKAPTPAAAMLSSVVMNAGFIGFYRVYNVIELTEIRPWATIIITITGLVSIFVATIYLVRVHNIKRLFAYSSVEHIGVVMLGIAAGGVGAYAAILHLILHSFAKSTVFLHIGQLYRVFGTKDFSRMGYYMRYSTVGATIMLISTLCITAMPPSGLFVTEFLIFKSLIDAQSWTTLIISLILLTIIVWAIGRDIFSLIFLPPTTSENFQATKTKMPWFELIFQFILIALTIWLGMATPDFLRELILQ